MVFYRISLTNLSPEPPYHLPRNVKISTYSDKLPRNDHLRQKKPPTKKLFNTTNFLQERISILLWCSHPYTYMMPYILLYILYPAWTNRFTRKAHPKNTVHQQRSIRHETPLIYLVIRPSFLSHTAYTLMVVFYIFALSLKKTSPKAWGLSYRTRI